MSGGYRNCNMQWVWIYNQVLQCVEVPLYFLGTQVTSIWGEHLAKLEIHINKKNRIIELIKKKKSIHTLRNTNLQATVEPQSTLALGKCSVKTVWKWDFFFLWSIWPWLTCRLVWSRITFLFLNLETHSLLTIRKD